MVNIAKFGTAYQTRAYIAYMGLGAGIADDIVYPSAFVDASGEMIDGAYNYTMHFDKADLPATKNGVWSISAYRENFYERNPINRYGLLPAMVKYNPDSSLDVYLQAKSPGPDKESNCCRFHRAGWLNVTLRVYDPKDEAKSTEYEIPPIRKMQ